MKKFVILALLALHLGMQAQPLNLYKDKGFESKTYDNVTLRNESDTIKNEHIYDRLDTLNFSIVNLTDINTTSSEIGATFFGSSILFSSNQYENHGIGNWSGRTGTGLYLLREKSICGNLIAHNEMNLRCNNGPSFYSVVEHKLYVTQNLTSFREVWKQKNMTMVLKVMAYTYDSVKLRWVNEMPFIFNNDSYNVAHVSVNERGDILAFASDMPNGFGGMDIYLSYKKDGVWGQPVNAGPNINTSGSEVFPSFYGSNVLFFASDGHKLQGGLDILYSRLTSTGAAVPHIIPFPVNSCYDDFGIQFSSDNCTAFFASNRPGGIGDDDIYLLTINHPFTTDYLITGVAIDEDTKLVLSNSTIVVTDTTGKQQSTVITDSLGRFSFTVENPLAFKVKGGKVNYLNRTVGSSKSLFFEQKSDLAQVVPLPSTLEVSSYGLILDKHTAKSRDKAKDWVINAETGVVNQLHDSTDEIRRVNTINYKFNEWDVCLVGSIKLDKVVKLMQENPDLLILLESYTDCRGSAKYNQTLSEKRAKSAAKYIIDKGINSSRVAFKGYGENRLLIPCPCEGSNKSNCPESEHAKNRRTEFVITKL